MKDEVVSLLKLHDYFRGVSDEALREVAEEAAVSQYAAGQVVHEPEQVLASVSFVVKGRLKAVRVDAHGAEHFLRMMDRGEQFGMMIGAVAEPVPVRVVALEPTTVVSLDFEKSMELTFKHSDLRRQWLRTFARGLQRHLLGTAPPRSASILAVLHESPAARGAARRLVERLRGLGEEVCVLSDSDEWRALPGLRFRALSEGGRRLEFAEIRDQFSEWSQARRIVVDVTAEQEPAWVGRLLEVADRVLWFVPAGTPEPAVRGMQTLDVRARGWRDKISVVWLLGEGVVAPASPALGEFAARDFKVAEAEAGANTTRGRTLANGLERVVHSLRGVRIGVALGGGAARGMSHLGVLKALEQSGIVVDELAGTSAGAMTGIVYSSGLDCDYGAREFATALKLPWLFRRLPSGDYWYLLYKYRRRHFDPMLRKYLRDWTLEQLPLPCHAVTVDLVGGNSVVRSRGDAVHAILESINLPGLSAPICRDGQALIDGGLVNNIPADVLVARGCNFVIAVSVTAKIEHRFGKNQPDTPTPRMTTPSTLKTLLRSLVVQNYNLNSFGVSPADVVIAPDVTGFDLTEFMRAEELAAVGEKAALEQVPRIQQLLSRLDPDLFRFDSR